MVVEILPSRIFECAEQTTNVQKNTLNPAFDECFELYVTFKLIKHTIFPDRQEFKKNSNSQPRQRRPVLGPSRHGSLLRVRPRRALLQRLCRRVLPLPQRRPRPPSRGRRHGGVGRGAAAAEGGGRVQPPGELPRAQAGEFPGNGLSCYKS